MSLNLLFHWLYDHIHNYNLFVTEIGTNDDADQRQEPAIVLKHQRYATRLYILLLIVSIYVVFVVAFMAPQTVTETVSNITPTIFHQLHLEYSKTLSCPCSTTSVPYKTFVFNTIKFHPICSSFFISRQWIDALYLPTANDYDVLDFRKTAHSQFKLLAQFCSLSKETISQNQQNIDNNEFLSLHLLPREQMEAEVLATVELFKSSAINRIISFINYLRIITRTNYFISALNTNSAVRVDFLGHFLYGGWMEFYNDTYLEGKAKVTCGTANPIRPSGFYYPSNDVYAGGHSKDLKIDAYAMVNGFFAGCTPIEALLPSTLDCLHDIDCLLSLLNYFPILNQTYVNWTDHILTKQENVSLNDHLSNLFLEDWSTKMNYSMYFNGCAPSVCTYTTITEATRFVYALTLLISLYGGLVLIFRLIVPFVVNTLATLKRRRRNLTINSGSIKNFVIKSTKMARRLNLFKDENERTEESIRQQKLTTRVYLILLSGTFLILVLFTSLKTQTTTIIIPNPSLIDYKTLENSHLDELKCSCSSMTIPYSKFLSLSPRLHQLCSSDFIREPWISIMMSIIFQSVSIDWRNQGGPQFQLLSDLCHLANKTIEDAIRRFLAQSLITSNVLNDYDFILQLNATLEQFIDSTTTYFGQIIDTVGLLMHVDQPLIQLGATDSIPLTNIFIRAFSNDESLFEITDAVKLEYSLLATYDVNSTMMNCICATNPHCQSLVGIYNNDEFADSPRDPELIYIVPGFIAGCFAIDSLMLSTLECFYSNSSCLSIISGYIEGPYHQSTDYPQPIEVRPLVYDSNSSRFHPQTPIASIVRQIMIEKWNPSISYRHYYEICAPSYCSYSQTLRAKTNIGIIILLLSTVGGLCASLKIITPYILHMIHSLFRWVGRRRDHHEQQQHQQQQRQDDHQIQLKWFDQMKLFVWQMMTLLYAKLVTLNLFTIREFGSHIDRITAEQLGRWTTRLYIILITVGIAILALYTIIQPQTLTKTFEKPSFNQYNRLKRTYGDELQCSCSVIASKYDQFVQIEPVFHQICSSEFVSDNWQSDMINGLVVDLSLYSIDDYRRFLPAHLQYLRRLCHLSIQSVNSSIDQFLSSLFVTPQLQSQKLFDTYLYSQIKQRESNTSNSLSQLLTLSGNINDGNAIISTYATNYQHVVYDKERGIVYANTQAMIYDNNCSCGLHQNCTTQANFIETNSSTKIPIQGLKMGCTPSESFRASTLECFYDLSCIHLLYQHTNYTNTINSTYLTSPLLTNISRFSIASTIAQLTDELFTELWNTKINYSSYFERCAPSICSYSYIQKLNSFYTVTLLLGLQGGLSFVLEWICPKLVRIIVKIYQRCKRHPNKVRPIPTVSGGPTDVVNITVHCSIAHSESIPTNVTTPRTRDRLASRCSQRVLLTCLLVLIVIAALTTFSVYFIRQAKDQASSTGSSFNTTMNMSSNTTTPPPKTSVEMTTSTTMSTCQLEFQPAEINFSTSYRALSPVVADFNGDNRSDIAVLVDFSTYVQILFGDNKGTLTSTMTLPEMDYYSSIAGGDFNNDRHIDIAFSGYYDNRLGTWLGNGNGTFSESITSSSELEKSPGEIFVAHFNNDSYLDVAISDYLYGYIHVNFGHGDGTFGKEISNAIEIADIKISMNVADFNNDSLSDIVASDRFSNYIVVYLGYGDGTFKRQKRMFTGPNFVPESVAVGDLNGDNQLDIVFSYNERNTVSIMFGYGNGTFRSKKNFLLRKRSATQPSVLLNDLNQDGLLDIITDGSDPYCIDVLINHGYGNFEAQRIFSIESGLHFTTGLVVGDFNGDGHSDILGLKSSHVYLNILFNTCNCCTSKTLVIL